MSIPKIVAVQQDDGSWAAYDDNKFDGERDDLSIGRGPTREEALVDLAEAYEFDDRGSELIRVAIFAIVDGTVRTSTPEARADDGWQPIETAPKIDDDTKRILVADAREGHVEQSYWSERFQCWDRFRYMTPTHWRPLPPAPVTK